MRRAWLLSVLLLLLAACGGDGSVFGTVGPDETTTTAGTTLPPTTTAPALMLDPSAPPRNPSAGEEYRLTVAGEEWTGRTWRFTAGGPVEVGYLGFEYCRGWTSVAPEVAFLVTTDRQHWVFSVNQDVLSEHTTLLVQAPGGGWGCTDDQAANYEGPFGPALQFRSAPAGWWYVWVLADTESASVVGNLDIATPVTP